MTRCSAGDVETEVPLPSGETLLVLVNHLKSKGFGTQNDSSGVGRPNAQERFTTNGASRNQAHRDRGRLQ